MGKIDQFGTGNAMSYSRKYAFLNLLNLKTGIKDESGYEPVSFEKNSVDKSTEPTYLDDEIDVEEIIKQLSKTKTEKQFDAVKDKFREQVDYLKDNNLNAYNQIGKFAHEHEGKLNNNQS